MLFYIFVSIVLIFQNISGFGHEFFYKNSIPSYEPRFDRDFLSSFDISVCCGSAHNGKNTKQEKVSVLDIYGLQDLYYTFLNYNKYPAAPGTLSGAQINTIDNFLALAAADTTRKIGKVSFEGKFRYCATEVAITQNLISGFFLEILIPFSRLSVRDIVRVHQSSTTNPDWTTFNEQLEELLEVYNLSIKETSHSGISDVTLLGGWTNNAETSDVFDFFDMSVRLGISIPTAKARNTNIAFAPAHGYNGHIGIPIIATLAWGLYDWLTVGTHVKGQYFLKNNGVSRVKTDGNETGYITLRQTAVRESLGNLWSIGTYMKADHILRGFSLQCNYNYSIQEHAYLEPFDTEHFSATIINTDERLHKWSGHEIYCAAEYDFAQDGQQWNPHIKVFYAQTVQGRRSYLTKSGGFSTGLYIIVNF